MKVAILQFNPHLGDIDYNTALADRILDGHDAAIDLLVLPELAFTGYNFPSRAAIQPFLARTEDAVSLAWARRVALTRQCHVIVGYPELARVPRPPRKVKRENGAEDRHQAQTAHSDQTQEHDDGGEDLAFNSTVLVAPTGRIVGNYRKSFLYYTDELWAAEGPDGGAAHRTPGAPTPAPFWTGPLGDLGGGDGAPVGHGICMDINPYRFEADWAEYEFATAMLARGVRFVVLSMAWLTRLTVDEVRASPARPDMETVAYWLERFRPFTDAALREPIVVVFANRCGVEGNAAGVMPAEDGTPVEMGNRVAYAGSSCVMHFQDGKVKLWGRHLGPKKNDVALMGKNEEGLLLVDTSQDASFMLLQGS